jgi:hypothetical protein
MNAKILAVNIILALGVCVLAVTLALLLTPDFSSADILRWLTTQPPSPCACTFTYD